MYFWMINATISSSGVSQFSYDLQCTLSPWGPSSLLSLPFPCHFTLIDTALDEPMLLIDTLATGAGCSRGSL